MHPAADAARAALAPPRGHGAPECSATLRAAPEDFLVEEDLGFAPAGAGQHLLLKVRKTDANTQWVARELARLGGCRQGEVGYAGLKDRRAVAIQWFSLPRPRTAVDWCAQRDGHFEVLETHAHTRKLPRGALAGNRFTVRLRTAGEAGERLAALLAPRLALIAARGVPNYFGAQRFGHAGGNLAHGGEGLQSLGRQQRGFVLSAARSLLFNALLGERVADGTWEQVEAGDLACLDGRGSFFPVAGADEMLAARCRRLQIHPTGPLWGKGPPASGARILALETRIATRFASHCELCLAAGMRQERRSLRLAVHELACESEPEAVVLRFRLTRGSFATAVLRELIDCEPPSAGG
jgi:tRNA pseudouridine13 synthase